MEESTAEPTAANAETLKRELKKILTEILSYGGGEIKDRGETDGSSGVLRAIDEAIKILNCLREVELEVPESDIPSSSSPSPSVEVPKAFKCTLSNAIMIEPVIIASGQTYEKRYITEWLKHEPNCPKSDEVLPYSLWAPNHLVDELISKWCRANKYDRLKPPDEIVTELSQDGIRSLLQRISSPSSVEDQREAAKELRCQTKKFPNVRHFFLVLMTCPITKLISPIAKLINPFFALTERVIPSPDLQENIIAALFNISVFVKNKTEIAEEPSVIPLLRMFLIYGTLETRRNSAATLLSLVALDSNKEIIGKSEVFEALCHLIRQDDLVASLEAASVVVSLCLLSQNMEKAISAGVTSVLISKIEEGRNAADFLSVLVLFSGHERSKKVIEENTGFIKYLLSILRKRSCSMSCEYAVMIVLNMCSLATPHSNRVRTRLTVFDEEENRYGTFTKLTKQGSETLVKNAETMLQWLKRFGAGKDPMMECPEME